MAKKWLLSALVLSAVFFCQPVMGIPFTTTTESTIESNPINESSGNWNLDWSYVYNFRLSTAVAVDPYWVLTAAHVADDTWTSGNIVIGDTTYTPQETRYYDGTATGSTNAGDATRDLALVRFDHAFPGYYGYTTGKTEYWQNDIISVGYGRAGTVTQTGNDGYWTEVTGDNAKRWGTNNIDGWANVTDSYGTYSMTVTTISGTNDPLNTPYETGFNINDSGGPMFVYDTDKKDWLIASININRYGDPYDTTLSVPVGDYDEWITEVIPEPMTASLVVVGAAAIFLRRRRR